MNVPFPTAFIEKLDLLFNEQDKQNILESFCEDKFPSLRINTIKTTKEKLLQVFETHEVEYEELPWYPNGFIIKNKTTRELTELDSYKQGFFYIQSTSSMIPALVLDPQPEEKILDIAAAPGSKTTQIAAIMGNSGEIVANEVSRTRIYKLEENLRQQGVTNTKLRIGLGEKIWQEYPEYFDKTLVDVPCSMEGRFRCDEQNSYDHWSPKKVKLIAKQQQWLLRSAISATKPGGLIVYSTCTLSVEENEEIIDWILKKEKNNIVVENIALDGLIRNKSILNWKYKTFHADIEKTLRINPSKTMEGFFIAKLRKTHSNVSSNLPSAS